MIHSNASRLKAPTVMKTTNGLFNSIRLGTAKLT